MASCQHLLKKVRLAVSRSRLKHASRSALRELDGWVRGRLRGILRKRARLKGRGRGRDHQRWPNHYFAALGLYSLEHAWRAEITSLRKGVNC